MKRLSMILIFAAAMTLPAAGQRNPFSGRWDITVKEPTESYPGWLEVSEKDGKLQVMVQPRFGNVRPATNVALQGRNLSLTVYEGAANSPAVTWELTAHAQSISGTQKQGDKVARLSGAPAPELKRAAPAAWGDPQALFNGKDLSGWEPIGDPAESHWAAKNAELVNQDKGANLKSTRKFDDFKLHVEFNCPEGTNSGIYLRGRYEVQVACGSEDDAKPTQFTGAIYGYLAPEKKAPQKAGQWQTFDITLVGRHVTVVHNGVTVIDNKLILGITGGALDSREAEPGPFYIQGDHAGGLRFRNITIALPKS